MRIKLILGILALIAVTATGYAQTVETVTTNGLFEPYGVAVDLRTNLYYLTDSANNRILKYNPANAELSTLISFLDTNHFAGFPEGIAVARGGLIVSDSANHAIYRISFDGDFEVLAGGIRGFTNEKGLAARFSSPAGLAADSEGNVYIADSKNNAIRKLAPDNTVSTYATGFYEPAGVAVGSEGRVFVADTRNHTIKVIGTNGAVSLIAGRVGISGGDDGFAGGATFNAPRALLWVGGETGLLVSDSGNDTIRRVYLKNGGWKVETFAGLIGQPGSVNGGLGAARFNSPLGLAIDLDGAILIADLYNNALRIIKRNVPPLPLVLPGGGSFSNTISLTLTSSAPNTVLFYTTDATDPTPFSSVTSGSLDLDGGPVILKVKGFSPDFATSGAVSNQYTFFVDPLVLFPPGGTFSNDTSVTVGTLTANVVTRFTTDGTVPSTNSPIWTDRVYGLTGPLLLRAFRRGFEPTPTSSNNFSFVVAPPSVDPGGITGNNVVPVSFSSSTAAAELYWTINGTEPDKSNGTRYTGPFVLGTNGTIQVKGFKNGYVDSQTSSALFNLVVGNPVISPAGGTNNNAMIVSLGSVTDGAKIYWTIDGSEPTPSSTLYTAPFTLGTTGTFKARAYKDGFEKSQIISTDFMFFVASPVISPDGAVTNDAVEVALSTETEGAQLFWTIDGKDPTLASTRYNGPFILATDGTLKVKGFKNGFVTSQTSSAVFSLTVSSPTITPSGLDSNDSVPVTLNSSTPGAKLFWTIDGTEPTTSSTLYTGPFTLGTNGTLKVKGFKNGFINSQTTSALFNLLVGNPTITPPSASSNNSVMVTLGSSTPGAQLFWTIDGIDPTKTSTLYTGPFSLGTNGTLKVKGVRNGFVGSQISSGIFSLNVGPPSIVPGPGTNINSLTLTIASPTSGANLYLTTDGSEVTPHSILYGGALTITTNTLLKVAGYRNGFITSPLVSGDYLIQVDKPTMSPGNGFFPNGTTVSLSVARPNASIYYTLNGQDPTPDDLLYTGPFQLNQVFNQGSDLRIVKGRAFALNTLPSLIVSGQPVQESAIGVPRDVVAGIGSTVVIPLVVNLQTNQVLRSLQFRIEVSPSSPAAPNLTADLRALNISSNDFVHVVGPGEGGSTALFNSSVYRTGNTNGLVVSAIGTNANFAVRNFATVAMLAVTIPATANLNDSYRIEVLQPSGTSDGQQTPVRLTSLGARSIVVSNISYVVGDSSLGTWYNAGDFGDGNLDNSDVNNAFYASLGVRVPYSFTDTFDAMDAFPDDTNGAVGGDGQIRFLDWQRILSRSLRRDANNWTRSWSLGGFRVAANTSLAGSPNAPATSFGNLETASIWSRQALLGALSQENVKPKSTVDVPIYLKVKAGKELAGLQFRAIVEGDGPALEEPAAFVPAAGLPRPISLDGLPLNQVTAAWPLVPSPSFDPALQESNILGHVRFVVPATAKPGQCYTLRFVSADGSPDANTQYDLESLPGCVWVQSAAPKPPEFISDEWKLNFFGSFTNLLAQANADADGDGVPNSEEFLAGTNPTKLRFHNVDADARAMKTKGLKLRWFAALGKRYVLESSFDLGSANWSVIAENLMGKGDIKEFTETDFSSQAHFYRVRVQP